MAIGDALATGHPDVAVWFEYRSNNLRLQRVHWDVPDGVIVRCRIWNNSVLAYDRSEVGPSADQENVPGNHTLVEVTEDGDTWYDLPSYLTNQFSTERTL